ncbi:hypothetical protein N7451_012503 [Penicillium sp. IBT 35674x]|nr:hypothetical protein N7451_012503 [Penicillium sp. IBT 35674x]
MLRRRVYLLGPRNLLIDGLLMLNIFGEETSLGWMPKWLLKRFFYRGLQDLAPANAGLYTQTPMVNDEFLEQVRSGRIEWLRGEGAPGGALEFFTYNELVWWVVLSLMSHPFRWKWMLFVLAGWGDPLPPNGTHQNNQRSNIFADADGSAKEAKISNQGHDTTA